MIGEVIQLSVQGKLKSWKFKEQEQVHGPHPRSSDDDDDDDGKDEEEMIISSLCKPAADK